MKTFKARGIVLRENPVGETDKYVDLLLKGIGKLSVSARGARKPGSKFLAGTQPFTYSDFVIYDSGKFNTMSQIDIIEGFYGLRNDYDKLCTGNYFLELCNKVIIPGEECDDLLLLLLKTLSALARDKVTPNIAARVFEVKFLQFNGYSPELEDCNALDYISNADFSTMFSFNATQKTLDELKRGFETAFNYHIGIPIKSRELI